MDAITFATFASHPIHLESWDTYGVLIMLAVAFVGLVLAAIHQRALKRAAR